MEYLYQLRSMVSLVVPKNLASGTSVLLKKLFLDQKRERTFN